MASSDRSKASASWGAAVVTVTATVFYQLVVVATSTYFTIAVIAVLAALAMWIVFTRKTPHLIALLCILGVCAFVETFGMLVLVVAGALEVGAQNMNVNIVFLSYLSMGAVDGAFLTAIFAIQAKKFTSGSYLMPAFGILSLATTIVTSLLHSRTA
jgi:hypothetical protein